MDGRLIGLFLCQQWVDGGLGLRRLWNSGVLCSDYGLDGELVQVEKEPVAPSGIAISGPIDPMRRKHAYTSRGVITDELLLLER